MKYNESVYDKYGHFFAKTVEICKENISSYNLLIDKKKEHMKFLSITTRLLFISFTTFSIITTLTTLGIIGFSVGIGTLIASNPILAAAIVLGGVIGGGVAIKLIWNHKETMQSLKTIGERYKPEFNKIKKDYDTIEKRVKPIEKLLNQCVKSICTDIYQINYDKQNNIEIQ